MKTTISLVAIVFLLLSCSSAKKTTTTKSPSTPISATDRLKGGTSFETAILIKVTTESAGVKEEYKWLAESYPGYALIRKTQAGKGNRHYDIITFKTKNGEEKTAYFDITSFFKKR